MNTLEALEYLTDKGLATPEHADADAQFAECMTFMDALAVVTSPMNAAKRWMREELDRLLDAPPLLMAG